jgi:hypothetical protein
VTDLSGAERAILTDLRLSHWQETDTFPVVRVTVYDAPPTKRPSKKRPRDQAEPTALGMEAQRQAFWQAQGTFVRQGDRTAERVSRWIRQLAGMDLSTLEVEELKAIGWEARVLIWMRHHRLGYQCPFLKTCSRTGPHGDCLSPVSLPLLSEIQRTLRRLPDVAPHHRKPRHLTLVSPETEAAPADTDP